MVKALLNTYELSWKPDKNRLKKPFYLSLATTMKEDIVQGVLPAYTKLPPQRELARYLELNVSTVTKAYKLCETNGLVTAAVGRGTFVAPLTIMHHPFDEGAPIEQERYGNLESNPFSNSSPNSEKSSLQTASSQKANSQVSYTQSFIPADVINLAYQKVSSIHSDVIRKEGIQMLSAPNSAELFGSNAYLGSSFQLDAGKIWLAEQGVHLEEHSSIFITMGISHALGVILSSLFQPGIGIAMDTYTSPYAAATMSKLLHLKMVPIENDAEGISATALEAACRTGKIKALFVLPTGNPNNITLSEKRKAEIAEVAKKYNLFVIEDDYMTPFKDIKPTPLYNLIPKQTAYISSVSQAISTGIRIAYIAVPNKYRRSIAETLFASMYKISPFDAQLAAQIISKGLHRTLIAEKQEHIRFRNWCFSLHFPDFKTNPLSIAQWIKLPSELTGKQVEKDLRALGVQVLSARHFALGERALDTAIYLATCGPETPHQLHEGLRTIKSYFEENGIHV